MLQYVPDSLQWFLLVYSSPLGMISFTVGFLLLLWAAFIAISSRKNRASRDRAVSSQEPSTESRATRIRTRRTTGHLWVALVGIVLIVGGSFLPKLIDPAVLNEPIAAELTETAKFTDVKLLRVGTTSQTPLTIGSVSYIGSATDVNGDPRQFRYTQYEGFGIYEMIGFDQPAVELKDTSYKSLEDGLSDQETIAPSPSSTPRG